MILDNKFVEGEIDKFVECRIKSDFEGALQIIESLIKQIENTNMYEDTDEVVYRDFYDIFEQMMYYDLYINGESVKEPSDKKVIDAPLPYAEIYFGYGVLLQDMERYDESIEALEKAMRWNPVNAHIAFEYASNLKELGEIDEFFEITKGIHEIIYQKIDMAQFYRNIARYCCEKHKFKEALCFHIISGDYFKGENFQENLETIEYLGGISADEIDFDDVLDAFEKMDIPSTASDTVLGIAYTLGTSLFEEERYDEALYFLEIFDDFYEDDEVIKMIEEISLMEELGDKIAIAIHRFYEDYGQEDFAKLIKLIKGSVFILPCDENGKPDLIEANNGLYIPIFSSKFEMRNYGDNFVLHEKSFREVIEIAENIDGITPGIIINPFTESFSTESDFFDEYK